MNYIKKHTKNIEKQKKKIFWTCPVKRGAERAPVTPNDLQATNDLPNK